MDCNWCAVCSKHFHSESVSQLTTNRVRSLHNSTHFVLTFMNKQQTSLYCSEDCRKTDALACCAFHGCDHPDESRQHDHLNFCHHHRPAVHIPSLPLLNWNACRSEERQASNPSQVDEWARFLEQQYRTQPSEHNLAYQRQSSIFPSTVSKVPLANNSSYGAIEQSDVHDCHRPCVIRFNKALPPPTLSPILPPSISNPASLSPVSRSVDSESDTSSLSHAWPTMDRFFFPDHCCRTSACLPIKSRQASSKSDRSSHVTELPPPLPPKHCNKEGGCKTMSESIWGTGWHQVEPMPASFVKTLQSNPKLLGHEGERASSHHQSHTRPHQRSNYKQQNSQPNSQQRQRMDSGHGHCHQSQRLCKTFQNQQQLHGQKNTRGRPEPVKANILSSSASSWSTICSSRLPRGLQFVE